MAESTGVAEESAPLIGTQPPPSPIPTCNPRRLRASRTRNLPSLSALKLQSFKAPAVSRAPGGAASARITRWKSRYRVQTRRRLIHEFVEHCTTRTDSHVAIL
eukprot:365638-Chlamydomonas_euryale.AAC.4